jgi:hypothetical protein
VRMLLEKPWDDGRGVSCRRDALNICQNDEHVRYLGMGPLG